MDIDPMCDSSQPTHLHSPNRPWLAAEAEDELGSERAGDLVKRLVEQVGLPHWEIWKKQDMATTDL